MGGRLPTSKASSGPTKRPVKIISLALLLPINLGRRCVPPALYTPHGIDNSRKDEPTNDFADDDDRSFEIFAQQYITVSDNC